MYCCLSSSSCCLFIRLQSSSVNSSVFSRCVGPVACLFVFVSRCRHSSQHAVGRRCRIEWAWISSNRCKYVRVGGVQCLMQYAAVTWSHKHCVCSRLPLRQTQTGLYVRVPAGASSSSSSSASICLRRRWGHGRETGASACGRPAARCRLPQPRRHLLDPKTWVRWGRWEAEGHDERSEDGLWVMMLVWVKDIKDGMHIRSIHINILQFSLV